MCVCVFCASECVRHRFNVINIVLLKVLRKKYVWCPFSQTSFGSRVFFFRLTSSHSTVTFENSYWAYNVQDLLKMGLGKKRPWPLAINSEVIIQSPSSYRGYIASSEEVPSRILRRKGFGRRRSRPAWKYYKGIRLERLSKNTKNLNGSNRKLRIYWWTERLLASQEKVCCEE
jgi:hypothetical protein